MTDCWLLVGWLAGLLVGPCPEQGGPSTPRNSGGAVFGG